MLAASSSIYPRRRGSTGVSGPGTAKVRVQLVADESRRIKEAALRGQSNDGRFRWPQQLPGRLWVPTLKTTETISPQSGAPTTAVTMKPTKQTDIFVQAGAFAQEANAQRARTQMAELGPVVVSPVEVAGQKLWRVRVGPLPDVPTADEIMARAIVMGHAQARIVVE
ncbi:MAG: SPOR domain-containing protein [Alphaproteobacteria bacterium]